MRCSISAMNAADGENAIRLDDPSSKLNIAVEALLAAEIGHLEAKAFNALPLRPLWCSAGKTGPAATIFHLARLQTKYDLRNVCGLQVDIENAQRVENREGVVPCTVHFFPVILHPKQDGPKMVFIYVSQDGALGSNWCLTNSQRQPVTFAHSPTRANNFQRFEAKPMLRGRPETCLLRQVTDEMLTSGDVSTAQHALAGSECGGGVAEGSSASRRRRLRARRRAAERRQQQQRAQLEHERVEPDAHPQDTSASESIDTPPQSGTFSDGRGHCNDATEIVPRHVPTLGLSFDTGSESGDTALRDMCTAPANLLGIRDGHVQQSGASVDVELFHNVREPRVHRLIPTTPAVGKDADANLGFERPLRATSLPWQCKMSLWSPGDSFEDACDSAQTGFQTMDTFFEEASCKQSSDAKGCGNESHSTIASLRENSAIWDKLEVGEHTPQSETEPLISDENGAAMRHVVSNSETQKPPEARSQQANPMDECEVTTQENVAPRLRQKDSLLVRNVREETSTSFGDEHLLFVIHELLGQGGFGSVYRCSVTRSDGLLVVGTECAIKVVDAKRISVLVGVPIAEVVPRLLREAEILHALGEHPHIVALHGVFYSNASHKIYLIYEYLPGGDLFNAVVHRRKPFSESDARVIFLQLAEAVGFGHDRGVAHRDLKMDNCLVEDISTLSVKLCDYGQAKFLGPSRTTRTLTSTAVYTAPDVQKAVGAAQPYDAFKADSFALGVLLYGLLCNALPNAVMSQAYKKHPVWNKLSDSARDLVQNLLVADASERLSVRQILQHPWSTRTPSSSSTPELYGVDAHRRTMETNLFLALHKVVVAMQRERGNCLLASAGERFVWHAKFTDEKYDEAMRMLDSITCGTTGRDAARWQKLRACLVDARSKTGQVRERAIQKLKNIEPSELTTDVVDFIVKSFSGVVTMVIQTIASSLPAVCGNTEISGTLRIQHKLLMLSAEQLGCERAMLCGLLQQPSNLQNPKVVCCISQMIGARKLLLGSASAHSIEESESWRADTGVVAGVCGLFPVLDLKDAPLLDAAELAPLEEAEDGVLSFNHRSAPQICEWYRLITQLIDKIHQHVALNILDHFR
mmetsp:Transcript_88386/g.249025  ORF Transcript_88386/g.249025 Transcript_88386/m.249025 type:complete len:1093 (-) Transcript_88386:202-3480(-)